MKYIAVSLYFIGLVLVSAAIGAIVSTAWGLFCLGVGTLVAAALTYIDPQ